MIAKEAGPFTIRIVNHRRETIKEVFNQNLSIGKHELTLNYPQLPAGLYYIEMWHNDKLAHFQEWNMK